MDKAILKLHNMKKHEIDLENKKLSVELDDGAKCNFKDNTLDCTHSAKSSNPYEQTVDDPSKDYRFTDEIKIENIKLNSTKTIKPSGKCKGEDVEDLETECEYGTQKSCEKLKSCNGKEINFKTGEDTKVTYTTEYPTYSDKIGSVSVLNDARELVINMQEMSIGNKSNFYFSDITKGGTQSNMMFDQEGSFNIKNDGGFGRGSELHVTANKQGTSYYTEPDAPQHDLEINIL